VVAVALTKERNVTIVSGKAAPILRFEWEKGQR